MNTSASNFKDKLILIVAACFLLFFILSVIQGSAKKKSTSSPEITSETKVVFVDAQANAELSGGMAHTDATLNELPESSNVLLETNLPDVPSGDSENLVVISSPDRERSASEISAQVMEKVKSISSVEINAASAYQKSFLTRSVRNCKMKEFGVEFKCDLGWEMSEDTRPEDASIVVSEDPLVILNWKIFDQKIRFLGQLNKFFFEKIAVYQKGYASDTVDFAGRQAVLVKGFDQKDPTMNRRDYFYLNNEKLVCVSFSYSSKEKEKEGRKIVEEVKDSFLPLEK